MKRDVLADRVLTYSDALVAFSLVNGIAFLVSLAEPDVRCSIVGISGFMLSINAIFPIAATLGLVVLGRAERRFRATEPVDDDVQRFWKGIAIARYVLVWTFAALVLTGILGATQDPICSGQPGSPEVAAMSSLR